MCSAQYTRRHSRDPFSAVQIGEITSGAFSPVLKKNVAMGYVQKQYGKAGTELKVSSADGMLLCSCMCLQAQSVQRSIPYAAV